MFSKFVASKFIIILTPFLKYIFKEKKDDFNYPSIGFNVKNWLRFTTMIVILAYGLFATDKVIYVTGKYMLLESKVSQLEDTVSMQSADSATRSDRLAALELENINLKKMCKVNK